MKKVLTALLVVAAVLASLGSCNFILGPDKPAAAGNEEGGTGNLVISIGGADREIAPGSGIPLPGDVLAVLRYDLTLTGPGGSTLTAAVSPGQNLSMTVMVGGWRIDARAYQENALAGTGSLNFTVSSGVNSVRVPMNMSGSCYEIKLSGDTANGTVRSNFTAAFPGTAITITAENHEGAFFIDGSLEAVESGTANLVVSGSGTSHSFAMPAADVDVYAGFVRPVRYVRAGGFGLKDGTSWENASGDLQKMMDESWIQSTDYPTYTYVVKVGAGTYKPQYKPNTDYTTDYATPANDRDSAFLLRPGVQVWGGYPAGGGEDSSRNVAANVTTLSGDLNGDDASNSIGDNAYHVVLGVNIPAAGGTVLDGLTIRGGNANSGGSISVDSVSIPRPNGGGMYNHNSSPKMTNVTICNNAAGSGNGGGMYNYNSSPVLIDATISENKTTTINSSGGGMYNYDSSPVLINVIITKNEAAGSNNRGGGIYNGNGSSPVLINVIISGNTAIPTSSAGGGGMYNGNGSSPVLINVRISGNMVRSDGTYGNNGGGGIYNYNSSPKLINVTISGNMATRNDGGDSVGGGGIFNAGSSSPVIRNSIIWGNAAPADPGISGSSSTIEYSMVEGEPGGTDGNQLAPSPVDVGHSPFADWRDPGYAPTTEGIYSLNDTVNAADAKNSGFNTSYPTSTDNAVFPVGLSAEAKEAIDAVLGKDLAGNIRTQGGTIDMGAYEY
jgi:hypothetical protein